MTNLTKAELVKQVANSSIYSQTQIQEILDLILGNIQTTLKGGSKVSLHGFGTFSTKERAARMGRNPATGASIQIEATTAVKFKPTSNFL